MRKVPINILILVCSLFVFNKRSALAQNSRARQSDPQTQRQHIIRKLNKQNRTVCTWDTPKQEVTVYWVNLEESVRRRRSFERHLHEVGFRHLRIHALTPNEYNIDVACHSKSPKEIACLISHLYAIHVAVYDTTPVSSKGKYALIVEDDVRFQFNVDFEKMADAAPSDFAILQIVTSQDYYVGQLWRKYIESSELWTKRKWDDSYWSTQGYLINKKNIKDFIDKVVQIDDQGNVKFHLMTNLIRSKCMSGCVMPFCLAADTFVYNNAGPCYTSNIPLLNGVVSGYNSTIHTKDHKSHNKAFQVIDAVVLQAKTGNKSLPSYMSIPKCVSRFEFI